MKKVTYLLCGILALGFSIQAQAKLIQIIDESSFTPLQINESFEAFYNYGGKFNKQNAIKYSSNTGYEQSDLLTLFLVENQQNEVALFGLIDKPKDKTKGELSLSFNTLSGDNSLLSFLLIDDSGDMKRKGTNLAPSDGNWVINWKWDKNYNDGFILGGFEKDDFSIALTMSNYKGLNGFNFINFDSITPASFGNTIPTAVNEPNTIMLTLVSFCLLLLFVRQYKNCNA